MAGPGAIPFEAVDRYAERFQIEDFAEFHALIAAMDREFLEHANEKAKTPQTRTP